MNTLRTTSLILALTACGGSPSADTTGEDTTGEDTTPTGEDTTPGAEDPPTDDTDAPDDTDAGPTPEEAVPDPEEPGLTEVDLIGVWYAVGDDPGCGGWASPFEFTITANGDDSYTGVATVDGAALYQQNASCTLDLSAGTLSCAAFRYETSFPLPNGGVCSFEIVDHANATLQPDGSLALSVARNLAATGGAGFPEMCSSCASTMNGFGYREPFDDQRPQEAGR
jgi:hypothetical protein